MPHERPLDDELISAINSSINQLSVQQPYVQSWHKLPFPRRDYELITKYQPASGLPENIKKEVANNLKTRKIVQCNDESVCSEPVVYSIAEDRFLTDNKCKAKRIGCNFSAVGRKQPLVLDEDVAVWDMWGMDCFTRVTLQSIMTIIGFDKAELQHLFLECFFLPVINSQPGRRAHDMKYALNSVIRACNLVESVATMNDLSVLVNAQPQATHDAKTEESSSVKMRGYDDVVHSDVKMEGEIIPKPGSDMKLESNKTTQSNSEVKMEMSTTIDPTSPMNKGNSTRRHTQMYTLLLNNVKMEDLSKAEQETTILLVNAMKKLSLTPEFFRKFALATFQTMRDLPIEPLRVHPKGVGIRCLRKSGLKGGTFVVEYLGELFPPWRWYEKTDAVKNAQRKLKFKPVLPDFYNIMLERHRDDEDGYDVMFVDPIVHGNFASRLSHSCSPNCATVVMAVNGRYVISVYTLREIAYGEELTFDYSSVTEDETEYNAAICLCGTSKCRGSFLYYAGLGAFASVMNQEHLFLHRQAMLLKGCTNDLSENDEKRLTENGIKSIILDGLPIWLKKWASLALGYAEFERKQLISDLMKGTGKYKEIKYDEESATLEAHGVKVNRVQSVAITLNKMRHFMRTPRQKQGSKSRNTGELDPLSYVAPLKLLSNDNIIDHLWNQEESVGKFTILELEKSISRFPKEHHSKINDLCDFMESNAFVDSVDQAKANIRHVRDVIWSIPSISTIKMNALGDVLTFWMHTNTFFTSANSYMGMRSPSVSIRNVDIGRDGYVKARLEPPLEPLRSYKNVEEEQKLDNVMDVDTHENYHVFQDVSVQKGSMTKQGRVVAVKQDTLDVLTCEDGNLLLDVNKKSVTNGKRCTFDLKNRTTGNQGSISTTVEGANFAVKRYDPLSVCYEESKKYQAGYIWGQLSSWYKQTIADPSASLSAERRGTISLPDVSSCFNGGKKYTDEKERKQTVERIRSQPHAMWSTTTHWSFRNKAKVYGSPWFDDIFNKEGNQTKLVIEEIERHMNG